MALDSLDLDVDAAQCVALLGHNGSGKTTALTAIAGLVPPTSGRIRINGADPFVEPQATTARRALAYVADSPVFYAGRTAGSGSNVPHPENRSLRREGWCRFVKRTAKELEQLMARDLSELDVAALMIDGANFADHLCVVALAITTDGTKVPVGLWLGDTENTTVVKSLLADLVDRGMDAEQGLLVVIDGAKALSAGVKRVFGDRALVQRCVLHKRRNVAGHLPKHKQRFVDRKLAKAFNNPDPDAGLAAAKALARSLADAHPDAAASLREGLEQMFTVRRLGVGDRLARSLSCTNAIESMISIARDVTRNVKHWRDGKMVKRWMAAGMIQAERRFRRIKGCADMPTLVAAIRRQVADLTDDVAPACDTQLVA